MFLVDRNAGVADAIEKPDPLARIDSVFGTRVEPRLDEPCKLDETRVGFEGGEYKLKRCEWISQLIEFFGASIEQGVLFEETAAARNIDMLERVRLCFERRRERIHRVARERKSLPVDDDEHRLLEIRKQGRKLSVVASRLKRIRNQTQVVRVDPELEKDVDEHRESEGKTSGCDCSASSQHE